MIDSVDEQTLATAGMIQTQYSIFVMGIDGMLLMYHLKKGPFPTCWDFKYFPSLISYVTVAIASPARTSCDPMSLAVSQWRDFPATS